MLFDFESLPDWNNIEVFERNKLRGRSYFIHYPDAASNKGNLEPSLSPYVISLCGEWAFRYFSSAMSIKREDLDFEGGESVSVPSVWQMTGAEKPFYVNVAFPFPATPPLIPFENPAGVYKRVFNSDKAAKGILSFLGVSSAFHVYINGALIGYSEGSHNAAEFNIDIREGKNTVTVLVYKWSNGSYLECQDMFRSNGIFRDVFITKLPSVSVFDIVADNVPEGEGFRCNIEIEHQGNFDDCETQITLSFGEEVCFSARKKTEKKIKISEFLPSVKLWSAETPDVYTLSVAIFKAGKCIDSAQVLTGFKIFDLSDGVFKLNGKPIKCRGVNHHDTHPRKGYAMSVEDLKRDAELMKRYNIDTVRFSHYPPHPAMLELCDCMGFYVIDEADIESHGEIFMEGGANYFSGEPSFKPLFLDRVERMFRRDRNHPCVLMWSLGNESGLGKNHKACYNWLKKHDPRTPVHYEGARVWKNKWGFDVVSDMYPSLEHMRDKLGKYYAGKPYFLCEYGHCMGVGPGGLKEYWDIILNNEHCMGGCIWEWADHCYYSDGDYRYGGDGGEYITDKDFCADGMCDCERNPKPSAYEIRNVYRPVRSRIEGGEIVFSNMRRYSDTSDISVQAELSDGIKKLCRTAFAISANPMSEIYMPLPFNDEIENYQGRLYLNLTYFCRGNEVGFEQHALREAPPKFFTVANKSESQEKLTVIQKDNILTVSGNQTAVFDLSSGQLISLVKDETEFFNTAPCNRGLNPFQSPARGFLSGVYRHNISNDMYLRKEWEELGLDKLWHNVKSVKVQKSDALVRVEVCEDLTPCKLSRLFEVTTVYEVSAQDITVTGSIRSERKNLPFIPRFGYRVELPARMKAAEYFGLGPEENYPDFLENARMGLYNIPVVKLCPDYTLPQEGGLRGGVEYFALIDPESGDRLIVESAGAPLFVTARPFASERFAEMTHRGDVMETDTTELSIDGFWSGIGSNSCGHPPTEKYRFYVSDTPQRFKFKIRAERGNKQ